MHSYLTIVALCQEGFETIVNLARRCLSASILAGRASAFDWRMVMTKNRIGLLASAAALMLAAGAAFAGGSFQTWPLIGGSSYCASQVTGSGGQICGVTVPAGPPAFTGTEVVPADLAAPGTNNGVPVNSALIDIQQLGQGLLLDITTVGTTQTIPPNVTFYALDGAQASALTVTMPAIAIDGQFQEVICEAATVGVLTVAANTSVVTQVIKNSPGVACVAGVAYRWRYSAANLTWYRV